ncbi:hypothetical protein CQW23_01410 [Capsicum baccatum]|uniref:Uncharacterized protein n=1 Tax=Capsicum baccatum TaxID=33114 RepID=A0A2G2XNI2_CAPBA|nr:hypothetical protein CQW23_01410 [Capsicum baccatum]
MVDYSEFSVFVAVSDALQPSWLVNHLRSYSNEQKDRFRCSMALVQPIFEDENGQPGGIGPISPNGAINYIWRKWMFGPHDMAALGILLCSFPFRKCDASCCNCRWQANLVLAAAETHRCVSLSRTVYECSSHGYNSYVSEYGELF